ncbi:MAG: hypothetical protein LBR99_04550 [Treponema sp.]|nr:hypothetical protein [Treponema sp.]
MRVKDIFSVFPRKLRFGKVVFYYQCYDESGNRSSGLSTGQITKTAARVYCMRLYREGNLFPLTGSIISKSLHPLRKNQNMDSDWKNFLDSPIYSLDSAI